MSEIIKKVRAEMGHKVKAERYGFKDNIVSVHVQKDFQKTNDYLTSYRIGVLLSSNGYCRPEDLKFLEENFIDSLKEQIYGNVRSIHRKLVKAVYERDMEQIKSALTELEEEIK